MIARILSKKNYLLVFFLMLASTHLFSQPTLRVKKLTFTVSSETIPLQTLQEHLSSLKIPEMTIKQSNNQLQVSCKPIFSKHSIATLIEKGFSYEIYPGIELPENDENALNFYTSYTIDSVILHRVKNMPKIAALSLSDDCFIWMYENDSYKLQIANKHNLILSQKHIQSISLGFEEKNTVVEISHTPEGQQLFYDYTMKNTKSFSTIFLQDQLVMAPYIIEPINSPSLWISGNLQTKSLQSFISLLFFHPYHELLKIENCKM